MSRMKGYWLVLTGLVLGAAAGWSYWYFVGCTSGTCPITSRPLNSTLYGAFTGALLFTNFQLKKNISKNESTNKNN